MKIYSYISYLLVSLSTTIVKAAETPSSGQEINPVNVDTDEPEQSSLRLNEFKEKYESRFCEFVKIFYHEEDDDKTPCDFDLALKHFESLLRPSKEFDKIFRDKNIEKIKSFTDLATKFTDFRYKWNKLNRSCTTLPKESVNERIKEENIVTEKLCLALKQVFCHTIDDILNFFLFDYDQSNKNSPTIYEKEKTQFKSTAKEFVMAFSIWFNNSMERLKNHNINYYYQLVEELKIILRCLNYNIYSLSLNCFKAFFKRKNSKDDREKFEGEFKDILLSFKDYVFEK